MDKIFISHISEEYPLANVLKSWIEYVFDFKFKVFVSSDPFEIPVGNKWFDELEKAIEESKILIVLYSPQSINRHWISFEAGCGWIKGLKIFPICHSGMIPSLLPPPISYLQGLEMEATSFSSVLLQTLLSCSENIHFTRPYNLDLSNEIILAKERIRYKEKEEIPDQGKLEVRDIFLTGNWEGRFYDDNQIFLVNAAIFQTNSELSCDMIISWTGFEWGNANNFSELKSAKYEINEKFSGNLSGKKVTLKGLEYFVRSGHVSQYNLDNFILDVTPDGNSMTGKHFDGNFKIVLSKVKI